MKPVYCINKKIESCLECIHRRGNKDCGGVSLDIKEHNKNMTFDQRMDRMRVATTEPPNEYYKHYKKYDDKGRPIVNTLNNSCIAIQKDKTIGWNNNCKSELKRLTDEWLKNHDPYNSLDIKKKVEKYQAGDINYYEPIRNEVTATAEFVLKSAYKCRSCNYYEAGIKTAIYKVCPNCHNKNRNEPHRQEAKKGLFVTLAGASAQSPKRKQSIIPQPGDEDYNSDEATHNSQIDLILEDDIFNESEKQEIIDAALERSLKTYSKDRGTFKAWFKLKFASAALDEYRNQADYLRGNPKKVNTELLNKKLKDLTKIWDYSILTDASIPKDIYNNSSDEEKRLMIIRTIAGAEKITHKQEYGLMGIKKEKHRKIQNKLNQLYDQWSDKPQEPAKSCRADDIYYLHLVTLPHYNLAKETYNKILYEGLLKNPPQLPVWPAHYPVQSFENIPAENMVNDMTYNQVLSGQADGYSDIKTTNKKYNYRLNYIMRMGNNGEIIKYSADGMPCRRCREIFDLCDLIKHWNLTVVTSSSYSMFSSMSHSDNAIKSYSDQNSLMEKKISMRIMVKNYMYICSKCNKKEETALFSDKYMRGEEKNRKGEIYERVQV